MRSVTPLRRLGEGLGELRGRALWVVLGGLVCQLSIGFGYVYAPLLGDITEELGLSRALFASTRAPTLIVIGLVSPVAGWLVVRIGARAVVLTSIALVAATGVVMGRAQGLADLYLGGVLAGLFTVGLGDITMGAVVTQWVTRARGLALGIVYTGSNIGAVIYVWVATLLSLDGSWRTSLLAIGLGTAAVTLPFGLFAVRDRRPLEPRRPEPESDAGPVAGEEDLTARQALRTRSFWILAVALFAFFFFFLAILSHFMAFLTDGGLPQRQAAAYYSTAITMGLVSKVVMGVFADLLSPRMAVLVDHGLLAAASILLLLVPASGTLPLFVVIFGFSYAARDVVTPLIIADCFGVRYLATIYGVMTLVLAPAGTLGGIFAGWSFDATGSYDLAFRCFAVLNVGVFGSLFLLRRETV